MTTTDSSAVLEQQPGTFGVREFLRVGFIALLIYYWAVNYLNSAEGPESRGIPEAVFYAMVVGPVLLFGALGFILSFPAFAKIDAAVAFAFAYFITVFVVSLGRADLDTIRHIIGFSLPIIVILAMRISTPPVLVNYLLFASVPLGFITWMAGWGPFSVIPGFGVDLAFRVSLFPLIPESGYLAAIVLLVNIAYRDLAYRWLALPLSAYFLLLSLQRSAMIAAFAGLLYMWLAKQPLFDTRFRRWLLFLTLVIGFIVLIVFAEGLLFLFQGNNELVNIIVFRTAGGVSNEDELARNFWRLWIWTQHLTLFLSSPLVGVGTFDFVSLAFDSPNQNSIVTGTESFLTSMMARVGLIVLLLIAQMLAVAHRTIVESRHIATAMIVMTFIAMLAYGSFINTYNFVYLILLTGVYWGKANLSGLPAK